MSHTRRKSFQTHSARLAPMSWTRIPLPKKKYKKNNNNNNNNNNNKQTNKQTNEQTNKHEKIYINSYPLLNTNPKPSSHQLMAGDIFVLHIERSVQDLAVTYNSGIFCSTFRETHDLTVTNGDIYVCYAYRETQDLAVTNSDIFSLCI